MALLNIFTVAILFAGFQRVDMCDGDVDMCQVCIKSPVDLNLTAGSFLVWDTFIENNCDDLCNDGDTVIKNDGSAMIVRAFLQVLVRNPSHCYFTFYFGANVSPVGCLVSGYNTSGGHYTQGSCEAMGKLDANAVLNVKVGTAQAPYPCLLRSNGFICLSALEILTD